MEYSQERKLRYIDKTVKELEKNKTRKTIDQDNFMKWFEIDKFSYKLMKNFISKEVIQYSKASVLSKDVQKIKKELDTNIKKMNVIHLYMNICISTFLIKYLDMLERVKFGTSFFMISSIVLFYYSNTYFSRYKLCHNFSTYCMLTNQKRTQLLSRIKNDYFHRNKEDNAIKQNLARYWKEPMAWH